MSRDGGAGPARAASPPMCFVDSRHQFR
jgi:hypothetical protein